MENVTYQLPEKATGQSAEYGEAQRLLADGLAARGITQSKEGKALLQMTVSQRPAKYAIKKGKGEVVSPAKEKKPFQSCEDKEYRLSFRLTQILDGKELYTGEASEYHCKATFSDSLPDMVTAALSHMDDGRGEKTVTRSGLE